MHGHDPRSRPRSSVKGAGVIFKHLTDDAIFAYVLDEPGQEDRATVESHFNTCPVCAQARDEIEEIVCVSSDAEAWDLVSASDHAAVDPQHARDFAERARRHDAEVEAAQHAMEELEREPVDAWKAWLRSRPRLHTAGTVHVLLAHAKSMVQEQPKTTMRILLVAESIARGLTDRFDRPTALGCVHHERATALRFLGRYPEALAACDEAQATLDELNANPDEKARVAWNRASILFLMERYAEARIALDTPKDWYRTIVDDLSLARVGILEGSILWEEGAIDHALAVFDTVVPVLEREGAQLELARVYVNTANCYLALRNLELAGVFGERAMAIFATADMLSEKIRTRWMFAQLLVERGDLEAGLQDLRTAAAEYEAIGMIGDAARVELERVELFLRIDEWVEAEVSARRLVRVYEQNGMRLSYVKALAYLREAVVATTATPALVRYVSAYLAEPQEQPFTPPPTPLPS